MRRKGKWLLFPLLLLLLLPGCKVSGHSLPEGMEADWLEIQGAAVVEQLNAGEWQAVFDALREDAQQTTSPEAIQSYMQAVLDKAGEYVRQETFMATGQELKDTGEEYGTAVFYVKHTKKSVMYRIAYSTDLELMGLEAKVQ